jgi:RNA-directed DNA polymerase
MNDRRESDGRVVPAKLANKVGEPAAEPVEERRLDEGNAEQQNARRTQSRDVSASSALDRVRQVAAKDRDARFTALLHHVDVDRLRGAYRALSPTAAAGVDGETWETYGQNLEENLRDLHARVQRGAYRAKPSRRVYIAKTDGRLRPLGIAALEDKIVQRAVVEVLNAIYETDFLGFSYGFRPGRGPHDALDALTVAIEDTKVNWVLDGVNGNATRRPDVEDRAVGAVLHRRWRGQPLRLVVLRGRPAGGGRKPPQGAAVKSRGAERLRRRRAVERGRCGPRRRARANH